MRGTCAKQLRQSSSPLRQAARAVSAVVLEDEGYRNKVDLRRVMQEERHEVIRVDDRQRNGEVRKRGGRNGGGLSFAPKGVVTALITMRARQERTHSG